jgi:general secretion pathway protein A
MYNSYFGFSVSPFSVTPDPNFFYSNPVYREAYANLRYGIEGKKGFIVITGEVGTGKTTLLRKLMHNLEGTIHSVFIFNTYLDFPELLQVIIHDLGLAPKEPNKVTMLQELNDYLITQLKQGHLVSVLVDEAQDLTDEALEGLRLLSNLETDQEKLVQIVLMGQPELQARLDRPSLRQLKQRIALQCRLLPLKDEEVGAYVDFRLRTAGYKGKDLFHRDALQQIALYSNGIPRLMNIICDNALLCGYARSQKIVTAEMIKEVARDLGLGAKEQVPKPETSLPAPLPETKLDRPIRDAVNDVPRRNLGRSVRVGGEIFLTILALVALASLINPLTFSSVAGRGLEVAKQNLNQWVLLMTHQEADPEKANPEKANAEVKVERQEKRVLIPNGSSIYKIAADTYRASAVLGMDLIKEFNPQIKNLNRVAAGKDLVLPRLTPETLLRQQSDGSYHLIVASFRSQTEADEYAVRLSNQGYQVSVTPRKVSDSLLLHRVEINGLKDFDAANKTWLTGLKNEWLAFAGNPDGTR